MLIRCNNALIGGRGGFDCIYAIVALSDPAEERPWSNWLQGADWSTGPVTSSNIYDRDIIGTCKEDWSKETQQLILASLDRTDTYYWYGSGEILIYSPKLKVAAFVRYGD